MACADVQGDFGLGAGCSEDCVLSYSEAKDQTTGVLGILNPFGVLHKSAKCGTGHV